MRFLLLSDFHLESLYDSDKRLDKVLNQVKGEEFDFVLNLGDFCSPVKEQNKYIEKMNKLNKRMYYTIGNHDIEHSKMQDVISFYDMPNDYYSVEFNDTLLIVLNSCYMLKNGEFQKYDNRLFERGNDIYPVIPDIQLQFLKSELSKPYKNIIVTTHHSLTNEFMIRGVQNQKEVRMILEMAKKGKELLVCFNGHDHCESREEVNGVHYMGMNSASYLWVGKEHTKRHDILQPYYEDYPGLDFILLFQEPLYSFVEIHEDSSISINGNETEFLTYSNIEMGVPVRNGRTTSSKIISGTYNQKKRP